MTNELPSVWLCADVVPVFKKGSSSDVKNYRPISLTCIACKVMERIVRNEMLSYLLSRKLISEKQHGFLAKRSTGTQLLECTNLWTKYIDREKLCLDVVYLDYAKAFDSVSHEKLLEKLKGYGIGGNLHKWLKCFLGMGVSGPRKQRVKINGSVSDWSRVSSGVIQGSSIGPLLFLLFVNDVSDVIPPEADMSLFADDMKVFVAYKKREASMSKTSPVQTVIDFVCAWSDLWQLNLAAEKCVILYIGNDNPRLPCFISNQTLKSDSAVRDLGVYVSGNLKFSEHCAKICTKAMSRAKLLFRCFKSNNCATFISAYKSYVRPLLENVTYVWSPYLSKEKNLIEKVQRYITRRIFNRCRFQMLSYSGRLKKLDLESLEQRRTLNDLVMTYNILTGKVDLKALDFFTLCANKRTRSSNQYKLRVPSFRLEVSKFSFARRIVGTWNKLPQAVVKVSTAKAFRRKAAAHLNNSV